MPRLRKKRASVVTGISVGASRSESPTARWASRSASHSGPSAADPLARWSITGSMSSSSWTAGPIALRKWSSTSAVSWPGRMRTSTSARPVSGMTFALVPAAITVGATVMWVQACTQRAKPGSSTARSSIASSTRSGSSSGPIRSAGSPSARTNASHSGVIPTGAGAAASRAIASTTGTSAFCRA